MPDFKPELPKLTDNQRLAILDNASDKHANSGEVEFDAEPEIREDAKYPGNYWVRAWVCAYDSAPAWSEAFKLGEDT